MLFAPGGSPEAALGGRIQKAGDNHVQNREFARFNRTPEALRTTTRSILQPGEVDAFYRVPYYTAEQMPRLSRILAIAGFGILPEEIRLVLDRIRRGRLE